MPKFKKLKPLFLLLIIVAPLHLWAQYNPDGSSSIYHHDFELGFGLHTRGSVLSTKFTKNITYDVKRQMEVDWVLSMKNFRESIYRNTAGARPFVFGKENELSIIRYTYGRQRIIADYMNSLSVRVNLHYSIGPNLALLKPIYYLVSNAQDNKLEEVRFDPNQHFYADQFAGAAKWSKGLKELEVRPGLTGKMALSFEWGKQDDQFKALETGLMVDLYGQRLPVMAFTTNDYIFINLYATLSIGNRW